MTPFTTLTGIAAPLPIANVDTDKIVAGRYLKTVSREGLGKVLFSALRQDPDFVLGRDPWSAASILIALDNFGCGSSREHAPWALLDAGIRCVIAPSIADIFYSNCLKNGILPVTLDGPSINHLMDAAGTPETATMTVDLPQQTIIYAGGTISFEIEAERKKRLLNGTDEIGESLLLAPQIIAFEASRRAAQPWLPRLTQELINAA